LREKNKDMSKEEFSTSIPPTMKAAVYRDFGEPDQVLRIENNYPTPKPSEEQILLKVDATSINPIDWKTIKGKGFFKKVPMIPCEDVSGTVVQMGPKCAKFQIGDKVVSKLPLTQGGGMAEYCVAPEGVSVPKPENLTSIQAASLPLAGLTALQALKKGGIERGKKVLILGASGGVGTFAVQIAKTYGCYVVATAGTSGIDLVKSLGADVVLDYKKSDWREELKDQGFDIIFDAVGGNWDGAEKVAKPSGSFVTIVGDEPHQEDWSKTQVLKVKATAAAREVMHVAGKTPHYHFILTEDKLEDLEELVRLAAKGEIKPVVDKVFPLDQAAEAFKYNIEGHAKGKVVVSIARSQQAL